MIPRLSVSDVLAITNQVLEAGVGPLEVEGEIAEYKVNQQKYVFFTLKDAAGSLSCFMTVWQLRVPLADGMRVVVRAIPKVTDWGKFSLTVQSVRPLGEGSLQKSFELLKTRLAEEGLFRAERKRSLPLIPERVAVISSTQAAGYADFMKITAQRWPGGRFMVAHVAVQGATAADQLLRALSYVNQLSPLPDVVVLLRGGGSADDLAAFNDEALCRAIAASRVPVLTGIGHETDETLCDLAADVCAATPSQAAELLVPEYRAIQRMVRAEVLGAVSLMRQALVEQRADLARARQQAVAAWGRHVNEALAGVQQQRQLIAAYDPDQVLRRGYALLKGSTTPGSVVKITTYSAIMKARIESYEQR